MAALKCDLKRVLADQAHILDAKLVRGEALDSRQAAWRPRFTATLGARADPPELFAGVSAAMTVLPSNLHHLAFAVDVDVEWKRVGVLQFLC